MPSGQDASVAVPGYVLFDFLESKGDRPAARWGHTAVVIDQKLIVYGGEGNQAYGDLQVFEPGIGCLKVAVLEKAMTRSHCVLGVASQSECELLLAAATEFAEVLLCCVADDGKWYSVQTPGTNRPPAMNGHAACSVGTQMYLYGGQQGRKTLHGLYRLCAGVFSAC